MQRIWRWAVARIWRSPNEWMLVAGVSLVVLLLLGAEPLRDMSSSPYDGPVFLGPALSLWTAITDTTWFWLAYAGAVVCGVALILAGLTRAAKPRM